MASQHHVNDIHLHESSESDSDLELRFFPGNSSPTGNEAHTETALSAGSGDQMADGLLIISGGSLTESAAEET